MPAPPSLRLVLVGIGSRGDVQPLLALGQTLRARGHRVLMAAAPNFATWVQSLGFDFAPVGVDMQQFLADNPDTLTGNPLKAGPIQSRFFASELPRHTQELMAICQGADALVWGGLGFAVPSVAERLGLPALGVVYTTCVLPSALHAPPTVRARTLPRWLNRALWWLHDRIAAPMVGQPLNQARRALGLTPVDLHTHLLDQCSYAVAVDEALFPSDPAWPQTVRRSNFLFLHDPAALDAELDAWLADGEAPVYLGFGSMTGTALAPHRSGAARTAVPPGGRRSPPWRLRHPGQRLARWCAASDFAADTGPVPPRAIAAPRWPHPPTHRHGAHRRTATGRRGDGRTGLAPRTLAGGRTAPARQRWCRPNGKAD